MTPTQKLSPGPRVYLISQPQLSLSNLSVFLRTEVNSQEDMASAGLNISDCSAAENLCTIAGRLCYMSFDKPRSGGPEAYLKNIIQSGHGSVLEHANFGFIFAGISRACSHQLVRHRAGWSYSQLSERYVGCENFEYCLPPEVATDHELRTIFVDQVFASANNAYMAAFERIEHNLCEKWCDTRGIKNTQVIGGKLADLIPHKDRTRIKKQARSAARYVLPQATTTAVFATANIRAIRHFLELRSQPEADREIRALANKVYECLNQYSPLFFKDYACSGYDGEPYALETDYPKV